MKIEQIAVTKGIFVSENGILYNKKGEKIGGVYNKDYFYTTINYNKMNMNLFAHRLQAYQKYGEELYKEGIVTRHLNGNKLDNSWSNIVIGTQSDNIMDIPEQIRIKRARYAGSFPKGRYNHEDVISFYNNCKSYKMTMENFKIKSKGTLSCILNKNKKLWATS